MFLASIAIQSEACVATCTRTIANGRARSPSGRGATNAGASVGLTCTAIQEEVCVATCTNTIANRRARSPSSRGATSAGVQVLS